jgi:hypothetical protein
MISILLLQGFLAQGRSKQRLASFLCLFAALVGLAGCGGGSSISNSGGGGGLSNPSTTPGNYAFVVNASFTANGPSQAQTTVAVTIQ